MSIRCCLTSLPAALAIAVVALILLILLAAPPATFAAQEDIRLEVSLDRDTIGIAEQAYLQVKVTGTIQNIPDPHLPSLPMFQLYQQGRSMSFQSVNGVMSSSVTHRFALVPSKAGTFPIDDISVVYNNKRYRGNRVELTVVDRSTAAPEEVELQARDNTGQSKDYFLEAVVDNGTPYVNEQITFTLKFYIAVQHIGQPELTEPATTGFWTEVLGTESPYYQTINGRRYKVIERKYALYPTQTGELTIGRALIRVTVASRQSRSRDPFDAFGGFFGRGETVSVSSKPLKVNVQPLPNAGRPADFSGTIGRYSIPATADKTEVEVNQPVTVKIEIRGVGNIKAIAEPTIPDLPDFRIYQASVDESINRVKDKLGGTRTFHRLACAIEDAGWEIRDCVMWVYGSGFPKSLDVGKALDRMAGVEREIVGTKYGLPGYSLTDGKPGGVAMEGNIDGSLRNGKAECDITAPATEAAKQWDGWGTALKPSYEPVIYAKKPLSVVPENDIIQTNINIGGLICLSLSNANNVERILKLSQTGQKEASVSAHLIAGVLHGRKPERSLDVMDMFKSRETARTILNIVESWKTVLDASCLQQNRFTTSMVTGLTTVLKTLNLLILGIIQDSTIKGEFRLVGQKLSVCIAGSCSKGENHNCKNETSVQEIVTWLTEQKLASIADQSLKAVASIVNTALHYVPTGTTIKKEKQELSEPAIIADHSLKQSPAEHQNIVTGNVCRKPTPNISPIILARKPLIGTVAENVLKHGTGGINIDGCRIGTESRHNPSASNNKIYGQFKISKAASRPT